MEVSFSFVVGSSGSYLVVVLSKNRHAELVMTQARSIHPASATRAREIAVEARENYHHYGVLFLDEVGASHRVSSSFIVFADMFQHPKPSDPVT